MLNWDDYPNFSESEFTCSCCGKTGVKKSFMDKLQALRTAYGKSMTVTSGYRCPEHPIEAKKQKPGSHASGYASDIHCTGQTAHKIMKLAFEMGFTGIGVNMKGAAKNRFIHLDTIQSAPRPNVWSY